MKKLLMIAGVVLVMLALAAGCSTTTTPSPSVTSSVITTSQVVTGTLIPSVSPPSTTADAQYPDDLVPTPGGYAYRGNVNQQGQVNPWPPVEVVTESLPIGSVQYRSDITTNAGQVRNDLVNLSSQTFQSGEHALNLYATGVPAGFTLERSAGAGLAGQLSVWLRIAVAASVAPGDYSFSLAVVVDTVFAGVLPVTVHVVTEPTNTPTAPVTTP